MANMSSPEVGNPVEELLQQASLRAAAALKNSDHTSIAAEVLGVPDTAGNDEWMVLGYYNLTGSVLDNDAVSHLVEEVNTENDWQRIKIIQTLISYIYGGDTTKHMSTLFEWHAYARMMRRYGEAADGEATALMIGSHTALSSRSFQCLADSVYGASQAVIVDPIGDTDKARHGFFMRASGLELPIRSGSMDFVHTNRLLPFLLDPALPEQEQVDDLQLYDHHIRRLFGEIGRVLAPGGQVFMRESLRQRKNESAQGARKEVCRIQELALEALGAAGVSFVRSDFGEITEGYDYLRDPKRKFDLQPTYIHHSALDIYARKEIE